VRGLGTVVNVIAILVGSSLGVLIGDRLPERTTGLVTDALGLVTMIIGASNLLALVDADYVDAVGGELTLIVVLGALLIGGAIGSGLRLEERLDGLGARLHRTLVRGPDGGGQARFVEGFVTASLIFCVGPLAILGSLSDGLGRGIDQLVLKSSLDGIASLAFASSLGWGVAASALAVGVWQGALTALAVALGGLVPGALIASLTATGGVLLLGVGMRLLRLRTIAVADLLPALVIAPLLTALVARAV